MDARKHASKDSMQSGIDSKLCTYKVKLKSEAYRIETGFIPQTVINHFHNVPTCFDDDIDNIHFH